MIIERYDKITNTTDIPFTYSWSHMY